MATSIKYLLVALAMVHWQVAVVTGQTCLPGQQECENTCCNTNNNYTCCPYKGGYCADPHQKCCESADSGLCPKLSTCCATAGCADVFHECCQDDVCKKGDCCKGDYVSDWFCTTDEQQCCLSTNETATHKIEIWPTAFPCGTGESCCSVLTSRYCNVGGKFPGAAQQDALNECCAPGTLCCPSASPVKSASPADTTLRSSYTSTACGTGKAKDKSVDLDPFTSFPQVKAPNDNVTACADPNKEFCCGGMACPTETLCCPGTEYTFGDGCCFGFASKDHKCTDSGNSTCPRH